MVGRRQKNTEKTMVSWAHYELVQQMIEDAADVQSTTKSAVIEKCVLENFLSTDENAREWVRLYLYGQDNKCLQRTLHAAFSQAQAGLDQARYSNLKPLVEYMRDISIQPNPSIRISNDKARYIDSYLKLVEENFKYLYEHSEESLNTFSIREAIHTINVYRNELQENLADCTGLFIEMINLIISYWNDVKEWRATYGLLQAIVMETLWEVTSKRRYTLCRLIKKVCDEWE